MNDNDTAAVPSTTPETFRVEKDYDPEQYLPANPGQWRARVQTLITALRDPQLAPCKQFLYLLDSAGQLAACYEGVVNEMAIRGGLAAA